MVGAEAGREVALELARVGHKGIPGLQRAHGLTLGNTEPVVELLDYFSVSRSSVYQKLALRMRAQLLDTIDARAGAESGARSERLKALLEKALLFSDVEELRPVVLKTLLAFGNRIPTEVLGKLRDSPDGTLLRIEAYLPPASRRQIWAEYKDICIKAESRLVRWHRALLATRAQRIAPSIYPGRFSREA